MSRASLLADVHGFLGQAIIECEDKIEVVAKKSHHSVMILDPQFNSYSIETDPMRLNVHTDSDGIVRSFSIG